MTMRWLADTKHLHLPRYLGAENPAVLTQVLRHSYTCIHSYTYIYLYLYPTLELDDTSTLCTAIHFGWSHNGTSCIHDAIQRSIVNKSVSDSCNIPAIKILRQISHQSPSIIHSRNDSTIYIFLYIHLIIFDQTYIWI